MISIILNQTAPVFNQTLEKCESKTCINGKCVSTRGGSSELKKKYPQGVYCKCDEGYYGDNHCSLSEFVKSVKF